MLLQTTLAVHTHTLGADGEGTLTTECLLVHALRGLEKYAEAKALGRVTLEKQRRTVGRDHKKTIISSGNLAVPLSEQGKYAEAAAEIERELLVSMTRLLGAEHKSTLIAANNLAVSFSQCGQKVEAGQLLHETLALARRALGQTHRVTQAPHLRALDLGAR